MGLPASARPGLDGRREGSASTGGDLARAERLGHRLGSYPIHKAQTPGVVPKGALRRVARPGLHGRELPRTRSTPLSNAAVLQRMHMYRVQDEYAEKKRVQIDQQGNVKIGKGPLNVSAGYPDHGLYFLSEREDFDVVEFSIQDDFYYQMIDAMESQKKRSKEGKRQGVPTFNDITKPGFKIEIPDGPYLEGFADAVEQGSGRVTTGTDFFKEHSKFVYSESELFDFVQAIIELFPQKPVPGQVMKVVGKAGLEYDEGGFEKLVDEVDWRTLNDQLWKIFNNAVDKQLRGVK